MNLVTLVGNLTKDPEHRTTEAGTSTTRFTVAVQRNFKNSEGKYEADFITCVAWRGTADFIAKYFSKGSKIGITGSIATRTYKNNEDKTVYVTEVNVNTAEFVGGNNNSNNSNSTKTEVDETEVDAAEMFADELMEFDEDVTLPF